MTTTTIQAEDYLSYVDSLTARLCRSFNCLHDYDDLRSCAYMGLLEAVKRYEDGKNVTFKQFAYIRITGAIIDGMRSLYAGSKRVVSFKRKLEEISRRLGTDNSEILAAEFGMTLGEFHDRKTELNKMCRANFTDLQASDTGGEEGHDVVSAMLGEHAIEESVAETLVIVDEVWTFLATNAAPREYQIMRMLYVEELTMSEAGSRLGVTECRVSQIHKKVITELQRRLFKIQPETNPKLPRKRT